MAKNHAFKDENTYKKMQSELRDTYTYFDLLNQNLKSEALLSPFSLMVKIRPKNV